MTERKKLSLRPPAQADAPSGADAFRKPPVRGTAPRNARTPGGLALKETGVQAMISGNSASSISAI